MSYKRAYEVYKGLWWLSDPLGMFTKAHVENKFGDKFNEELAQVFYARYPRRKKLRLDMLDEETIAPVKEKWQRRAEAYLKQKARQYALLRQWLDHNCYEVSMDGEWGETYSQSTRTYSSQPGKHRYAYADAKKRADLLERNGIPWEIVPYGVDEEWQRYHSQDLRHHGDYHQQILGYTLFSPLQPWQLDALERRNPQSLLEWATECWRSGQNPRVLNPYLPYDIFEQSQARR